MTLKCLLCTYLFINSLAPGRCGSLFKTMNLKLTEQNSSLSYQCEFALWGMPQNLTNEKSWLGAIRQQAITWTNVDQDLCRHMAPLGHNELTFQVMVPLIYTIRYSVITVSAEDLAHNSARASTGTVVTTKFGMISLWFSLAIDDFKNVFMNRWMYNKK